MFARQYPYHLLFMIPGTCRHEKGIITVGHCPPRVSSLKPPVLALTKSPRPPPSVFAYCKRSKTGSGSGLGTRLEVTAVGSVTVAMTLPGSFIQGPIYGDVVAHNDLQ